MPFSFPPILHIRDIACSLISADFSGSVLSVEFTITTIALEDGYTRSWGAFDPRGSFGRIAMLPVVAKIDFLDDYSGTQIDFFD